MNRDVAARALGLARWGHAQWFFGNLYEAIVRVPDHLATHTGPTSPAGRGSPVRYYALATPATLPALAVGVVAGWRDRGSRPWLVTAAACSVAGFALTGYLVRNVNLRLFFGDTELSATERDDLLRTWYRINGARMAATGGAWLAVRMAAR